MSLGIWYESQSIENTQDRDDWFCKTSTQGAGKSLQTMQNIVGSIHRTGSIYGKRYVIDERKFKDLNAIELRYLNATKNRGIWH
jgi:hypothetical protein